MKKTLLLAFAVACGVSAAQAKEITFTFNEGVVANGSTVEFTEYEEFDWGTYTEVFIEPKVFVTKDSSEPIDMQLTSDYPVQLCIGGQCEAAMDITKEDLTFPVNTLQDLMLDCSIIYMPDEEVIIPEITVNIKAWYQSTPENPTSFTIKMGTVAAIHNIVADTTPVKVAANTLSYNVNGTSVATIFNTAGQQVLSQTVSGNGTLNLNALPAGIYIYSVNGVTGKFIVR